MHTCNSGESKHGCRTAPVGVQRADPSAARTLDSETTSTQRCESLMVSRAQRLSTDTFRRDSAPFWWLEAVRRHLRASGEYRYCFLSRNRIGPVKLEEGSITCPFFVISSTPSQANCTAMRRASGIRGRHAVVRARGASEGQHVFVRPRLCTSSRILALSAPSVSGLHSASSVSSRRRLGIPARASHSRASNGVQRADRPEAWQSLSVGNWPI